MSAIIVKKTTSHGTPPHHLSQSPRPRVGPISDFIGMSPNEIFLKTLRSGAKAPSPAKVWGEVCS